MTNLNFILNGRDVSTLVEANDIEINIDTINSVPSINVDAFTFVGDSAQELINWFDDGCNGGAGIFEGVPLDVNLSCGTGQNHVFNLFVDLADEFCLFRDECKVLAKVKVCDTLETLDECMAGNSFDYLRSLDTSGYDACCVDVPYIVEKIDVGLDLAFLAFATFIALYQTIEATITLIKGIIGLIATPVDPGLLIQGILKLIADAIFLAAMIIYTINLIKELIDYIYPPIRNHKAIKVLDMLKKAYKHCGYEFKYAGMDELDCLAYLPSRPNKDKPNDKCVPLPGETGYFFKGLQDMVLKLFNADRYIKDGCVYMYSSIDSTLINQSSWRMPKVYNPVEKFNSSEYKATNLMQFATDVRDGWTVVEYEGNAFQRRADAIYYINSDKKLLRGLNECNLNIALGAKKTELSPVEEALKSFLKVIGGLLSVFGSDKDFTSTVTRRLCMLKVENNIHNVPKLLAINPDGKLKDNHRDILSAPALYKKYYNEEKQYGTVEDLKIPFCCDDFFELLCNTEFFDCEGRKSFLTGLSWNWSDSFAVISYKYETKYTNNIKYIDVTPE